MSLVLPVPHLLIRNLVFRLGDRCLFDGLSAELGPGVNLVQGGDGRGKSSLLRLLAGVLTPENGQLTLHGADLLQASTRLRQVFWMEPQSTSHDQMSGLAYLKEQSLRFPHFENSEADSLIELLGLDAHIEKPLYMLSTGSKRKVWACAAFASQAPLTLLDMPFAALDKTSIERLLERLAEQAQQTRRIWVIADYAPPPGVRLAGLIDLGD